MGDRDFGCDSSEFDACMETPQNHPHHCWSVGEHILHALPFVEADKTLRLAVLLHDIGKPLTRTTDEQGIDHFYNHAQKGAELANQILRRLKFDNDTRKKAVKLVLFTMICRSRPPREACAGRCTG